MNDTNDLQQDQPTRRLQVTFELEIIENGDNDEEILRNARQAAFDLIFLGAKSDILTQQLLDETSSGNDVRVVSIERAAKKAWKRDLKVIEAAAASAIYQLVKIEGDP